MGPILLGVLGLVAAVAAVIGYRRRPWGSSTSDEPATGAATAEESTVAEAGSRPPTDDATAAGATATSTDTSADGSVDESDESTSEADADAGDSAPPVDEDLLSNEEQVLRLVEENGGRMKQKRVAEELDWTAAKTSQVVTGLRDEGDLDGFRLGRENVLSLPEYDAGPDGTGGGNDDEK
jgi:uncharacterized membrane protein